MTSHESVTSGLVMGDDGKAQAPSPLVERMRPADEPAELAPTLHTLGDDLAARPAHEVALLAGLHARSQLPALLPTVLAQSLHDPARADAVAAARIATLEELDAYRVEGRGPGPFLGPVGPIAEARDPRRAPIYVTTVERVAMCPWQAFLSRVLRIERPPDALEALPEPDALLKGSLVHAVLERIVTEGEAEVAADAEWPERLPRAVAWPDAKTVDAWLVEAAERLLFENGIGLPGFAPLLAAVVRPHLEVVRAVDWAGGDVPVVGAELDGSVEVETTRGSRSLRFRADRVDRVSGGLRLTDYKTGKPLTEVKSDDKRHEHLLTGIREGRALQAAAYAHIAPGAEGRLLYSKPEAKEHARELLVRPVDEDLDEAFRDATDRALAAWEEGGFVPRLVDRTGDAPAACQWCDLSEACLRGDSGARRRVESWAASVVTTDHAVDRAMHEVWRMRSGK